MEISLSGFFDNFDTKLPANIYLFRVNNRNTRKKREICSKLAITTSEQHHCRHFGVLLLSLSSVSIVEFEQVNGSWAIFIEKLVIKAKKA